MHFLKGCLLKKIKINGYHNHFILWERLNLGNKLKKCFEKYKKMIAKII